MELAYALLENLGLLALASLALFLLAARHGAKLPRAWQSALTGLVLGVASIMVLNAPIPGPSGSIFDTRAAPLLLAGLLGGPVGGGIAAALAAAARYGVGGGAALGGMVSAGIYAAVGVLASHPRWTRDLARVGPMRWIVLAIVGTVAVMPTFFIGQPVETALNILAMRWHVLLTGNLIGVAMLGMMLDELRKTLRDRNTMVEMLEVSRLARSAAGIGIWRYDFTTDRLEWDDEQCAIMRTGAGAFGGNWAAFRDMVLAEDWPALERTFLESAATLSPYRARFRVRTPDGAVRHIRCSAAFVGGAPGRPKTLIGVNTDETDEVALQSDLALKGAALDSAVCGVVITGADHDNAIVHVNRAFTTITGYGADEALGRNCRFLNAGLPDQPGMDEVRRAIEQGGSCEVTLRNRRKSGELFWNRLRLSAIRDPGGRVTHFIGVQEDVSREIATRDCIAEARDHLAAVLAAAPDAVMTVDADRRITMFNAEAERLFGWRAEEIIGQDIALLVPEAQRTEHEVDAARYLADPSAEPGPMAAGRITEARRRDGTVFPAHINLARHVRDGVPAATVIAHDMTSVVESQRAVELMSEDLARQLKAAEAANEAKTRFLAVMSHELRTPLNGALGMAQLLELTELDDRQADYVRKIGSCGRALLTIIEDLLDMTRLAEGQARFQTCETDLRAAAAEAVAAVSAAAEKKGIAIQSSIDEPADARPTLSDPERVRQILINLISNAVKFSDGGAVRLNVRRNADGSAVLSVQDEGRGIPQDKQAQIFERFWQVDQSSTRRHGGVGLGLAICRDLVRQLGGEIGVESEPGRGATFRFTLPARAPGAKSGAGPEIVAMPRGPVPLRRATVVIVDDDPVSARFAAEIARAEGFTTLHYPHAKAALGDRAAWGIDPVFLLDLHMPDMNGVELAAAIRREPGLCDAAIAILTADARFDADQARTVRIDAVQYKPLVYGPVAAFLSAADELPPVAERPVA
jgi:PAS domain S-box-containing protein